MNCYRTIVSLVLWAAVLASALQAQPSNQPNRVLELDGMDSQVELPRDFFTNLTEASVEEWVNWERFQPMSRVLDFAFRGKLVNL